MVSPIAGVPALKDAQKLLMRRLRIFMYCGILWATLAAGLRLLFSLAYRGGPFKIDIWIYGKNMEVFKLFMFMIFGHYFLFPAHLYCLVLGYSASRLNLSSNIKIKHFLSLIIVIIV